MLQPTAMPVPSALYSTVHSKDIVATFDKSRFIMHFIPHYILILFHSYTLQHLSLALHNDQLEQNPWIHTISFGLAISSWLTNMSQEPVQTNLSNLVLDQPIVLDQFPDIVGIIRQ